MSSTGRGGDRAPLESYPTPRYVLHRLLEHEPLPGGIWLEPCSGAGSLIRATSEVRDDVRWLATDIDESYMDVLRSLPNVVAAEVRDATELDVASFGADIKVVATNPPFSLALPILKRCLAYEGALTIFLQRLNWCGGPRAELFRRLKPSALVLPDRPSFRDVFEDGKIKSSTDSIEYAWWKFDGLGRFEILANTPAEVRRAEILERRALAPVPEPNLDSDQKSLDVSTAAV